MQPTFIVNKNQNFIFIIHFMQSEGVKNGQGIMHIGLGHIGSRYKKRLFYRKLCVMEMTFCIVVITRITK